MKKAFDQTVRDLKRGVNKKVLKVPGIEQKVLDATSNEPWGPHGSHLADIAQATQNYQEYQMIMNVIWKRVNDTGKNWHHVYKALTVLEYLVGHGSERVIDEMREHAYQISTLLDFQYIDSKGRDQGSNVRRKSQSLVSLANDKERIEEVRQKAIANRNKYRNTHASGGRESPYPGSRDCGDYHGGHYRDEDRNVYSRERDWSNKDDERDGSHGDSYCRDGDHYVRDSDECYERDNYRDEDYRGGRSSDDYSVGTRKSHDRERDYSLEDDYHHSSRNGCARVDDPSLDDRWPEQKLSEQSIGVPPSYEETIRNAQDRVQDERGDGNMTEPGTKAFSPSAVKVVSPASTRQGPHISVANTTVPGSCTEVDGFDEFDPRGFVPAAPSATNGSETDLFASPSASDLISSLALVPVGSNTVSSEADVVATSDFATNFVALSSASATFNQAQDFVSHHSSRHLLQPNEDPFGDAPFKATKQEHVQPHQQSFATAALFQPSSSFGQGAPTSSFDFGDALGDLIFNPSVANPPPVATSITMAQPYNADEGGFLPTTSSGLVPRHLSQQQAALTNIPTAFMNYPLQSGAASALAPQHAVHQLESLNPQTAPVNHLSQPGLSVAPQSAFTEPGQPAQPVKDKFQTKSTVWTDTLNRGLVNLNISGAKINPLVDIGIDFDSINRMEKRKEKSSAAPVTSMITMGKAMGSGSGIGRAGAGGLAPPSKPMSFSGMGTSGANGMGMGMLVAGVGGYGGCMNQQMAMGMGMYMGTNQGAPMHPSTLAPGTAGAGYNSIGMGGYAMQQQHYGVGYR